MQHKRKKNVNNLKKEILLKAVGEVINSRRTAKNKGILLLSYEYDLPSNSLERIEKGLRDPQLTTLWKIVNALDMDFIEFIETVNRKLPEGFKLTDD